jgi:predicted GNAT family acetyltransferase
VEAVLLREGFIVEGRPPLMTCTPGAERELRAPDGIDLIRPQTDDELLATLTVQHEAYDEPDPPGPKDLEALRSSLEAGGIAVLAREARTDEPAGAGVCSPPHDGITEVAGIGVRLIYRRRGIAGAMTVWLTREAFAEGVTTAFLMAAAADEARIYGRAGYVERSRVLHISR